MRPRPWSIGYGEDSTSEAGLVPWRSLGADPRESGLPRAAWILGIAALFMTVHSAGTAPDTPTVLEMCSNH